MKVFSISDFWKDDESEFEDFLVAEYDDVPEGYDEEDISISDYRKEIF